VHPACLQGWRDRPLPADTRQLTDRITLSDREVLENARVAADRGGSPVAGVTVSGAPELDVLCGHVQRSWLADGALG
jgi:hypothetical protein